MVVFYSCSLWIISCASVKLDADLFCIWRFHIFFHREILKYKNANSPLADTDLDILVKSKSGDKIQVEKGNDSSLQSANLTNSSIICEEEPVNTMTDCANEISDSGSDVLTNSESRDRIQVEKGNDSTLDSEAQLTALKLSFTLPSSCYATMAIRELLKTSTSVRISTFVVLFVNFPFYVLIIEIFWTVIIIVTSC